MKTVTFLLISRGLNTRLFVGANTFVLTKGHPLTGNKMTNSWVKENEGKSLKIVLSLVIMSQNVPKNDGSSFASKKI